MCVVCVCERERDRERVKEGGREGRREGGGKDRVFEAKKTSGNAVAVAWREEAVALEREEGSKLFAFVFLCVSYHPGCMSYSFFV